MALPVVKSLEDCGSWDLTAKPFLPQLYALPANVLDNLNSLEGLKQLYVETNPLVSACSASLVLGVIFVVVSEINRNYSQVDRMWSILPNLYNLHMALWARMAGLPHSRLDLICLFTTIWSCRLTFNYWRRGGYKVGSEDYRWEIVQSWFPAVVWHLFNIVFIAFIQSFLLFAFGCTPTYAILLSTRFQPEISTADYLYFAAELALVFSEWISDGQQWAYQTAKYKFRDTLTLTEGYTKADVDRGFNTSGLWAYSRHPNFIAEQTIWFVLYNWSCYATNSGYSWTGIGSVSLIMLFQGSTFLTEDITAKKYPEYEEYQRQVGMFFPTSLKPYSPPARKPRVIRSSDFANRQKQK